MKMKRFVCLVDRVSESERYNVHKPLLQKHVYIGKFNNERECKQRYYLLWPLLDILSIANSNAGCKELFEIKSVEGNFMLQKCSFCKPFETIDDMKSDFSSDIDGNSETDSMYVSMYFFIYSRLNK